MTRWHQIAGLVLALACSLLAPLPAAAQTGVFQRVRIGGCLYSSGSADPEGSLTGNPCDVYTRTTGGTNTTVYRKETGTGTNTGWISAKAPVLDATFITQTAHAGLSAEQAMAALATGFLKVTTGTGVLSSQSQISLTADVSGDLPYSSLAQGSARSVLGVAGNATADVASIQGTTNQILRVDTAGTGLGFGSVNLASSAAVGTTVLPIANGGTNVAAWTANRVVYATATDTLGSSANLNFDGSALMVGTNTPNGASTGDIRANDAIYERTRSVPIGQWTTVTFSAGNFTSDVGTWTVESGDVLTNQYTLIGSTMIWSVRIDTTSIASSPTSLRIAIPNSCVSVVRVQDSAPVLDNSATQTESGVAALGIAGTIIQVFRANIGAAYSASTNLTGFRFTISFEVSGC